MASAVFSFGPRTPAPLAQGNPIELWEPATEQPGTRKHSRVGEKARPKPDPLSPRRTGLVDLPHPALPKALAAEPTPSLDGWASLVGQLRSQERKFAPVAQPSSRSPEFRSGAERPKRNSVPLTQTCFRHGPFAPRSLVRILATTGRSDFPSSQR